MGFELSDVIKGVLYNKDGTVDYVFDDVKINEIVEPFQIINEETIIDNQNRILRLSSDCSITLSGTIFNDNVLYQLGVIHWYDWWNGDEIEYNFEVNI